MFVSKLTDAVDTLSVSGVIHIYEVHAYMYMYMYARTYACT